jgi:hypothetical protein
MALRRSVEREISRLLASGDDGKPDLRLGSFP